MTTHTIYPRWQASCKKCQKSFGAVHEEVVLVPHAAAQQLGAGQQNSDVQFTGKTFTVYCSERGQTAPPGVYAQSIYLVTAWHCPLCKSAIKQDQWYRELRLKLLLRFKLTVSPPRFLCSWHEWRSQFPRGGGRASASTLAESLDERKIRIPQEVRQVAVSQNGRLITSIIKAVFASLNFAHKFPSKRASVRICVPALFLVPCPNRHEGICNYTFAICNAPCPSFRLTLSDTQLTFHPYRAIVLHLSKEAKHLFCPTPPRLETECT